MKSAICVLTTVLVLMVLPVLSRYPAGRRHRCPKFCPRIYAPVCGSNGKTYKNVCLLKLANCLNICTKITVAHRGRCECVLQAVTGPCRAAFRRYYFDMNKARCEVFIYGGCRGNGNNFKTKRGCTFNCPSEIARSGK